MDPNSIRPTRGRARGRPVFSSTPATRPPPTTVQGLHATQPPSQAMQSTQPAQPMHSTHPSQPIRSTQPGLSMPRPPRQMPPRLPSGLQQRAPRPSFGPRGGGDASSSSQQNPMPGVRNYL